MSVQVSIRVGKMVFAYVEVPQLLDAGFECVTEVAGARAFRRRK